MPDEEAAESGEEGKPKKKPTFFAKAKEAWGQLAFGVSVVGAIVGGYVAIDNKLDEYEQRGVDISDLKESNAALRAEIQVLNDRLSANVNEGRNTIIEEFRTRDEAARARDTRITAIINEVRARHGVIPLADAPSRRVQIQRYGEAGEAAARRVRSAQPEEGADPLAGLGRL